MGVTIYCKKTGHGIDMGYFGFNALRNKVAELNGEPFYSHMMKLEKPPYFGARFVMPEEERKKLFEEFDAETQRMVDEKLLSVHVENFCMQPDVGGKIRHTACRELLKVIGDYDDDVQYGYSGRKNCAMFADFKALLQECVDNKCMLIWH